ncbi:hypothetical protein SAMN04487895_101526 [Paenibacillus sophorae]|uniref:Uncharacterized protein n=1 Tax=Paenibacillus sophorae TaxID=1333845 RepID=A0A1H8GIW0_9BACL|nr:hypothetical protein [Paenibacillus sophorae]QWU14236.1 hypothetical protein KP014_20205 [Paenibacillus sophorae]SEN43720.1 hypothetical protein SAMN04487895_101526 [Paenibacillus sophorae]
MNKNNNIDWFSKAIGNIVKMGILLFLAPVMTYSFGWLGGRFLEWVYGGYIANGFNLLFNVDYFKSSQLPIICGTLAVIGGYLKYSPNTNSEIKGENK